MSGRLPTWLKVAYTLWLAVWIPTYWVQYGPLNFLWLCDVANLILAAAIWLESPLLFASQATSVLVIQFTWIADFLAALTLGVHPIGGTEYMFDAAKPLPVRLLSLFHAVMPVLLLWGIRRLGYDPRGWKLQALIAWLVLPASFLLGSPEQNLNWLWRPFGIEQTWLAPPLFLLATMVLYPALLYFPTHLALAAWSRRPAPSPAGQPA